MCMWQSQAPSGALRRGGPVPAEFDTCWPWLCRTPIADAVAAIATIEALLMKVRRAIMSISLISRRMEHPVPDRQEGPEGFGYHFPEGGDHEKNRHFPRRVRLRDGVAGFLRDLSGARADSASRQYRHPPDGALQDDDERRARPRGDHPQDRARSRKRQRSAPPSRQPHVRLRARRHLRGESRRRSAAKARAGRNVLRAARRAARGLAQRQLGPPGQVSGHPDLRSDQAADGARVRVRDLKKIILIAAFLGAASQAAQFAAAQSAAYPSKPVHVILPFPPGGSVDTVARLVMPRVSERLGQQFLIENRSGASGNIGTEYVARAAPDGYTLMVNTIPFVANSHMYAKLPFDPLTDFAPISLLASSPSVLVVHPSLAARSVRELLELARSKPGGLYFATAGPGTNPHIAAELFNYLGKVKMVAIHYKGGGPALLSTVAGDTEIIVSGASEDTPVADAGELRAPGL